MKEIVHRAHGQEAAMNYVDGYDRGLRDGSTGAARALPRLRRYAGADMGRRGYDDGYADGIERRKAREVV